VTEPAEAKRAAREAALAARRQASAAGAGAARQAAAHALDAIAGRRGVRVVSGYLPIRHEIDPLPAMLALDGLGYRICVPVIDAPRKPLGFRAWAPGVEIVKGTFGVLVPATGAELEPDAMLVPMLAFDARGFRLGYGGGFYDRTVAALRARRPLLTLGFAFAAQRVPDLPVGPHDQALDAIVTEDGIFRPSLRLAEAGRG
jgi:5-formyltetrahydrofolate cyclo-ligase